MESKVNRVENGKLRALYAESATARSVFDYFADRRNNSKCTSVDRLQSTLKSEGHDVSRGDIIDLFKSLATAGCGTFVVGRKGHPSRFEWDVSLVEAGQAATGEEVKVQTIDNSDVQLEVEQDIIPSELIEHRFMLRPGLELRFELPTDFSAAEAARVADYVRTLPFIRQP